MMAEGIAMSSNIVDIAAPPDTVLAMVPRVTQNGGQSYLHHNTRVWFRLDLLTGTPLTETSITPCYGEL